MIFRKIEKVKFNFLKPINNIILKNQIDEVDINDLEIQTIFSPKELGQKEAESIRLINQIFQKLFSKMILKKIY